MTYTGAWLAETLDDGRLDQGEPYSVSQMSLEDLGGYAKAVLTEIYGDSEQFPRNKEAEAALGNQYYAYFKAVVGDFLYSALGVALEEPLTQNTDTSIEDGISSFEDSYFWNNTPSAVLYEMRPYARSVEGAVLITDVEMIGSSNAGYFWDGLFRLWWQKDENSRFGYVIIQIQKLPEAGPNISGIEALSTLISYERSDKYQVSNVLDHDLSTAWVEGVGGYGEGESLTLTFDAPEQLHGIKIADGRFGKNPIGVNGREPYMKIHALQKSKYMNNAADVNAITLFAMWLAVTGHLAELLLLFTASPRIVTSQAHLEFLLRKKSLLTPVSCSYAANSKCLRLIVNSNELLRLVMAKWIFWLTNIFLCHTITHKRR